MSDSRRRQLILLLLLVPLIGCQSFGDRALNLSFRHVVGPDSSPELLAAESAFAQATEFENRCNPACVDFFYRAAISAWPVIERQITTQGEPAGRAEEIYHGALRKLITRGQEHGRFDPATGLQLQTDNGPVLIPTVFLGFIWQSEDFDQVLVVSQTSTKKLNTWYRCPGLGVATIAMHRRRPTEKFRRAEQTFPATLLLRPVASGEGTAGRFEFVFADPFRVSEIGLGSGTAALTRNTSAPLAFRLSQKDRQPIQSFLQPGSTDNNAGLFMTEPYQPGKIPVLFVHGLLSDPLTWANAANEMLAQPDLFQHYQVWGFEYATGEPFLSSAAALRKQLVEMQLELDPTGSDPLLSQVVVVGHSMGGLVAKLMVTQSGTTLWDAVSCQPFDQIKIDDEARFHLADAFFFDPSPAVGRVIFMGTPHRGSPWAKRPIGRLGAKLVKEPVSMDSMHRRLISDNPGVFSREFTRRIPTSIDLLRADSPLLLSIDRLPFQPQLPLHSIIGEGYCMLGSTDSDGIVPVSSARNTSVVSEKRIHAKHGDVNETREALDELFCILRQHVQSVFAR